MLINNHVGSSSILMDICQILCQALFDESNLWLRHRLDLSVKHISESVEIWDSKIHNRINYGISQEAIIIIFIIGKFSKKAHELLPRAHV